MKAGRWVWVWRAALAALVVGAAWQKHADDLRARAMQMRASSETNARLEELVGIVRETIARLEELRQATGPRTR
jgi:hypothetical protein